MTELPASVTAAYITATGPAENIRLGELPMPSLGPTDVLMRAEVVAVNHVDTFVRSGAYRGLRCRCRSSWAVTRSASLPPWATESWVSKLETECGVTALATLAVRDRSRPMS